MGDFVFTKKSKKHMSLVPMQKPLFMKKIFIYMYLYFNYMITLVISFGSLKE